MAKKDRVGERYGRLLITERLERDGRVPLWRCRCDCGATYVVTFYTLRETRACTNCNESRRGRRPRTIGQMPLSYLKSIEDSAARRGIRFRLGARAAWRLFERQGGRCALSGLPLSFSGARTASLDRLSSDGAYGISNVQWVHREVNLMKRDFDNPMFIQVCKMVAKTHRHTPDPPIDLGKARGESNFWKAAPPQRRRRPGIRPLGYAGELE